VRQRRVITLGFEPVREASTGQPAADADARILSVTIESARRSFRINGAKRKAEALKAGLSPKLQSLREFVNVDEVRISDEAALSNVRYHLYTLSRNVARDLFDSDERMCRFAHLLAIAVHGEPGAPRPIFRIVASWDDPLAWWIPYELLPVWPRNGSAPTTVRQAADAVLGFRAVIVRAPRDAKRSLRRSADGRVGVTLFPYEPGTTAQSLPGIEDQRSFLGNRADIALKTWPHDFPTDTSVALESFAAAIEDPREILHFACHYASQQGPLHSTQIDLGIDRRIDVAALNGAIPRTNKEQPLIFLNACAALAAPLWDGSLLQFLLKRQFHNLIGAETALSDAVAARFTRLVYDYALALRETGDGLAECPTIADAIVEARNALIDGDSNNPAGIFYTFYGSEMLRAEPPTVPGIPPARGPTTAQPAAASRWRAWLSRTFSQ
jgi:hypothetical protein